MVRENPTRDAVLELWREARNPRYIAQKLNLEDETGHPDVELVEMIIDDSQTWGKLRGAVCGR